MVVTNQLHNIGEVLPAPRCKLQLNEGRQIKDPLALDDLTYLGRFRKGDGPGLAAAGKKSGHKNVEFHIVAAVDEAPLAIGPRVISGDESLLEFGEALGIEENIDTGRGPPVTVSDQGHGSHDPVRDIGLTQ